jgi:hypothetical protein
VITDRVEFIANPYGIFMQSLMVRRRIMTKAGEFDAALRVIQYIDMVFRIFLGMPLLQKLGQNLLRMPTYD